VKQFTCTKQQAPDKGESQVPPELGVLRLEIGLSHTSGT